MKKFFRKFFFWDEPSAGAVFGYLLAAVSGVGKNKLDDNGVYDPNRHPAEPAADDLRALLIKEELEK